MMVMWGCTGIMVVGIFIWGDALDGLALDVAREIGVKLSKAQIRRGLEDSVKAMISTIRNVSNFLV